MLTLLLLLTIVLLTLIFGIRPWRRVAAIDDTPADSGILPKISIVAYAMRNEHDLPGYLDRLLQQDYPDFEIILVCDASAEATAMLSEKFENLPNLHITFIPPGSHSLSRRKLAQTVGIKAASGEVVIFTATSAMPLSGKWLRYMAAPFADRETAAALGFIRRNPREMTGAGRPYRIFDYTLSSAQWIAAALAGHPFRACGFNLALRRHIFFDVKGYASSITLMDGDDDIFIRRVAEYGACQPVIARDAFLECNWGARANNMHADLKDRWNFTRRFLPRRPFVQAGLTSAAQWITPILAVATILLSLLRLMPAATPAGMTRVSVIPQWILALADNPALGFTSQTMAGAAAVISTIALLSFWITESLTIRACARKLDAAVNPFMAIFFLLWRPVGNLIFRINHHHSLDSHLSKHN